MYNFHSNLRHINTLEKFSTSSEVPQNHNDLPSGIETHQQLFCIPQKASRTRHGYYYQHQSKISSVQHELPGVPVSSTLLPLEITEGSTMKQTCQFHRFHWVSSDFLANLQTSQSKVLGPVVRKVDSAIRRIVIFSNFLKLFIYWDKSRES